VPGPAPAAVVTATPITSEASTTTDAAEPVAVELAEAATSGDTQPERIDINIDPSLGTSDSATAEPTGAAPAANADLVAAKPVPATDGVVTLSPENTKIQFVGVHSPPKKPDPRTGGFAKFSGKAEVDADGKVKSVSVDIDTTSLFTSIPKLTDHLKSGDFFEVREHPTAKFESTKIAAGEGGEVIITGNLTLHGVTKEISFPAKVESTDSGLTVTSKFDIDRTQFGMTYGNGQVEDKVHMTVIVGEKTEAL
jgi:polyisoprenoid-binding protein YceI